MKHTLLSAFALLLLFSACKKGDPYPGESDTQEQADAKDSTRIHYADLAEASYTDAVNTATALQTSIAKLLARPTQANLDTARRAWILARIPYSRSEAYRFYDGPIEALEPLINSWPLDEGYIDYTQSNQGYSVYVDTLNVYHYKIRDSISLIANTPTALITPDLVARNNAAIGPRSISSGYHAIEFLLWGQDLSTDGPGARPVSDYIVSDSLTAHIVRNRRAYLSAVTTLLVQNLTTVRDAWTRNGSYRATFLSMSTNDALGKIFRGMGALAKSETANERIRTALADPNQENEQSCFSDNTSADILNNVQGIQDVYMGIRRTLAGSTSIGPSPFLTIYVKDQAKANTARDAIQKALISAYTIPSPFDQAIINNQAPLQQTANNLDSAANRLVDAAAVYKISVSTAK